MKSTYTDGFFSVNSEHGFLPIKDPLEKLPEKYTSLQYIIDILPTVLTIRDDSKKQTLSTLVHEILKDYSDIVKEETNILVIHALYRAYSFLTSAYLLEPSYLHFITKGEYGQARNILPKVIAVPYKIVSDKLGVFPWLDYHYAYALGNYVRIDKNKGLNWKNLKMACKFTNTDDETGFIMLHVYINELSKDLVKSIEDSIESITLGNIPNLVKSLELNYNTMKAMNERKREMWVASNYKNYDKFRVFIMGSQGNEKIFGDGVIYEGVSDEKVVYRGQSGAMDDIIPFQDVFSGINNYYEDNELTSYLIDLRKYRPPCIRKCLADLENNMNEIDLFEHIKSSNNNLPIIFLLGIVCEIYNFRFGHFNFVKKYIMENTKYPIATGGTPIQTWLPNQMKACKKYYDDIKINIKSNLSSLEQELLNKIEKQMKFMTDQE